jgi:H+/Cl- antiporter ClcA
MTHIQNAIANAIKLIFLASLVAVLAGTASAVFLWALQLITQTREANRWLIALLPIAGFAVGWVYLHYGQSVEAGNNLLIDEIHDPKSVIPLRMAPLVLGATLISHLFGASVGREGTAVQMGGALADQINHVFKLTERERRILLIAGISAGFASVFGTPLAGMFFGLEVLVVGRVRLRMNVHAILPCGVAAMLAHQICAAWMSVMEVGHAHYVIGTIPALSWWNLMMVACAAIVFGLTARAFAEVAHRSSGWIKQKIAYAPARPLIGGIVIASAVLLFGLDRYIGIGDAGIAASFQQSSAPYDFLGKMVFTIASLSSGFKGGEVTPLFYIGATLGSAIAPYLQMAVPFLAAIGFVAVFAGAANVPLACTLMAIELFGAEIGFYAGIACLISYLVSGNKGIYAAQRLEIPKHRL